jgi:hypothetical protein
MKRSGAMSKFRGYELVLGVMCATAVWAITDQDHLLELLAQEVITPAEKLIEKRQQRLDAIFGRAPKKLSPPGEAR